LPIQKALYAEVRAIYLAKRGSPDVVNIYDDLPRDICEAINEEIDKQVPFKAYLKPIYHDAGRPMPLFFTSIHKIPGIVTWLARLQENYDFQSESMRGVLLNSLITYLEKADVDPLYLEEISYLIEEGSATCTDRAVLALLDIGMRFQYKELQKTATPIEMASFLLLSVWMRNELRQFAFNRIDIMRAEAKAEREALQRAAAEARVAAQEAARLAGEGDKAAEARAKAAEERAQAAEARADAPEPVRFLEVEMMLAYPTLLKESLNIIMDTKTMVFGTYAPITKEELAQVTRMIKEKLQGEGRFHQLAKRAEWLQFLFEKDETLDFDNYDAVITRTKELLGTTIYLFDEEFIEKIEQELSLEESLYLAHSLLSYSDLIMKTTPLTDERVERLLQMQDRLEEKINHLIEAMPLEALQEKAPLYLDDPKFQEKPQLARFVEAMKQAYHDFTVPKVEGRKEGGAAPAAAAPAAAMPAFSVREAVGGLSKTEALEHRLRELIKEIGDAKTTVEKERLCKVLEGILKPEGRVEAVLLTRIDKTLVAEARKLLASL
jgi:hypothetical protein